MEAQTQPLSTNPVWANLLPVHREQVIERIQQRRLLRHDLPSLPDEGKARYQFEPAAYISDKLGWEPWAGDEAHPGQVEILDAYVRALQQQHERDAYENGEKTVDQLQYWKPGDVIQNWLRLEGGHNTGKTKVAAAIVSHFFDHFNPSVTYTYAPSWEQIHDLLWKEIKDDRDGKSLAGRVLDSCEIKDSAKHFAKGRATDNSSGKGRERSHGQHEKYQLFVLDEAEGIPDFLYDALPGMTSGGISIVILLANPRTRTSRFHKLAALSYVVNFRLSCLYHPNVLSDREIVPGAVRRSYVLKTIEEHCETVDEHDEDNHTFTLPWEPAIIYKPDSECMFTVLGIAPANSGLRCFVPTGRFEAASNRKPISQEPHKARMGLDCQRDGTDFGRLYVRHDGAAWLAESFQTENTYEYSDGVKKVALDLKRKSARLQSNPSDWKSIRNQGITSLHIRVDAGGGFGAGPADRLRREQDLIDAFPDFQVIEVHFGSSAKDAEKYFDKITEITADAAESLKGLAILNASALLEQDLTERLYDWRNVAGKEPKKLEKKDEFRKRHSGRSPDDGDGFVLAVAGEGLFTASGYQWDFA